MWPASAEGWKAFTDSRRGRASFSTERGDGQGDDGGGVNRSGVDPGSVRRPEGALRVHWAGVSSYRPVGFRRTAPTKICSLGGRRREPRLDPVPSERALDRGKGQDLLQKENPKRRGSSRDVANSPRPRLPSVRSAYKLKSHPSGLYALEDREESKRDEAKDLERARVSSPLTTRDRRFVLQREWKANGTGGVSSPHLDSCTSRAKRPQANHAKGIAPPIFHSKSNPYRKKGQ